MDTLPPRKSSATEIPYVWVRRVRRKTRTYWYWTVPGEKRGTHRYFPYTVEGLLQARAAAHKYQAQREEQLMSSKDYGTSDHPITREEWLTGKQTQSSDSRRFDPPQWWMTLENRERAQIHHALNYAENHQGAGVPGHSQLMLIAKLARQLEELTMYKAQAEQKPVRQYVRYDENEQCWRDLMTGVKVVF